MCVAERVAATLEFARARRIAVYSALADELPTHALVAAASAAKKALLWPRVSAAGDLELAAAAPQELEPDAAGVLAPPAARAPLELEPGDVILVPGVAFARDGARLGRGGGHYDRLLARCAGAVSVGVAFDIQVVADLPTEPHDRRVDIVATPNEIWRVER